MLKVMVGTFLSSFFRGLFGVDWQTVDRKITRAFPAVEFISTENLLAEQQLSIKPTIIDVRLPEEYDVSHIPKAHNLQSADAIAAALPDYAEAIIVYCSVGYRSAAVAEELASMGYQNVKNLRHSIFEWGERGYDLEKRRRHRVKGPSIQPRVGGSSLQRAA